MPDTSNFDAAVLVGVEIIKTKPEGLTALEAVQRFQHQSPDFVELVTRFNKLTAALPAVVNGHHLQSTCAKWVLDESQQRITLPFETIAQRVEFYAKQMTIPAYAYLMDRYKERLDSKIATVRGCLEDQNYLGASYNLLDLEETFQEMVDRHDDLVSDGYP
ncbi:hypothetical protein HOT99_gp127 [Caulobacter phage CcrBL10]|uniref:Uncharacterized protein n=1 Tax=Caulobacter phage CcrBL10 TaxID=2283269 RepID=A0A385E9X8_9CAUD|nr:hypothetical protein HOT99_gp127 [Caulobacter phage CcrBL10]AXQ68490.1 hypothetical protein CcrBL10_gp286 [Caulobacter phage CcrBL10]